MMEFGFILYALERKAPYARFHRIARMPQALVYRAGGRRVIGPETTVKAELTALEKTGSSNFALIEADLKADGELKSSASLLKTLSAEGNAASRLIARGIAVTNALIKNDVNKLAAAAKALAKKPTGAALRAKELAASSTLSATAVHCLAEIDNDVAAQKSTDSTNLGAILSANPTNTHLASDTTNTIRPASNGARTTLTDAASMLLVDDVDAVIAALVGP